MSMGVLIYLGALAVAFVSLRLLDGYEGVQTVLVAAAIFGVLSAIVLRVKAMTASRDDGIRFGHRRILDFFGVAVVGLVLYGISRTLDPLESERAWGILSVAWPALVFLATVPLLVIDHALASSPVVIPVPQVKRAMWNGLSAAFAVALIFPLNYVADRHDESWDFSYFRTADPGEATRKIAAELPEPIRVRIFQPPSSEVLPRLENYFAVLDSPNLKVEVVDQAAEPALARELKIRDNGYIAFTQGEVDLGEAGENDETKPRPKTQQVKTGVLMVEARDKLKDLDREVQKALLQFTRGDIKVYITGGHGELAWQGNPPNPMKAAKGLKQILQYMNLDLAKLGITEGLAEGVPEDADVVLVLGPDRGLLPAESKALRDYIDRGGALMLAVEPEATRERTPGVDADDAPVDELLAHLGVKLEPGVLASNSMVVPMANNVTDRLNVATNRFSSHPSTVVLSKHQEQLRLFTPGAGALSETRTGKGKTNVIVRSMPGSWLDLNQNLEMDGEEKKETRPIAVVAEGAGTDRGWRALIVADASLFADFPVGNPGNQQFIYDSMNWLTHQEGLSGEVESEEDVRIQHTKEGQAGWFYSTVVGIPLLFLAFGAIRLRVRRRRGGA